MKRFVLILAAVWTATLSGLGVWLAWQHNSGAREMSEAQARAHFAKDQAFRLWGASHGGVYVPISGRTPPNPYLAHVPERDIETPSGKKLTLMNPAYMLRQLMEDYGNLYQVKGRITSLKPLRPENAPDEWERRALEAFDHGETEVLELTSLAGQPWLRLMRPMIAEKDCLKCHAAQGYKEGDVRGGVGVSFPMAALLARAHAEILVESLALGLIWLSVLVGIGFGGRSLAARSSERDRLMKEVAAGAERYRLVADFTFDWEHWMSPDGRFDYVSPACARISGYDAEEFLQDPGLLPAIAHPEDREMLARHLQEGPGSEKARRELDFRILTRSGEERWIGHTCQQVHGVDGAYLGRRGSNRDITERRRTEGALHGREAILEAVSFAAGKFLGAADWRATVAPLLARLGAATQVSRSYVFENHSGPGGEELSRMRFEWAASGIAPQSDSPDLQCFPWRDGGMKRWAEVLGAGHLLTGHVRQFPPSEQELLRPQNILSVIAVPIFVENKWWGFIGFDECAREREWSRAELDALQICAGVVGAAIQAERTKAAKEKVEDEREAALVRALRTEAELGLRDAAIEAAASAIVLTDRAGTILWVNHAFTDLTGWEREAAIGQRPSLLSSGTQEPTFYRQLWQTILSGAVWRGELTNRRKDGSPYREEMTITPLRDGDGEIAHFVAIKQSLVWRDDAERRLRESEQSYRDLVEGVDAIVWEAEVETGRLTFVNRQVETLLGYRPEDLIADPYTVSRRLVHPDDRQRVADEIGRLLADAGSGELELRVVATDGRVLWLRNVLRSEQRAGTRVLAGFAFDVTRSRALELAVKTAADEWIATFDAMEYGVLVVDANDRLARLNRAALELLGTSWTEAIGCRLEELQLDQPWHGADQAVAQVRAGCQSETHRVRDGGGRTWEIEATAIPGTEAPAAKVIVSLRDVSQIAELQESVRRVEIMAALGTLVAGVAHEVRNPLYSISVNLEVLESEVARGKPYEETLGILHAEVERLSLLMEDLLDYGRQPSSELSPGSLASVVAGAIRICGRLAGQRGVRLAHAVDEGLPAIRMDRVRLVQVFQNLLQNAVQHSPREGTVTTSGRACRREGRTILECTVEDEGPGLPPEDLPRLFEPFFTRRRGGTGLGLAIVQKIVEEHGGSVTAENRPGGGARLTVCLPAVPAEDPPEDSR